MAKSSINFQRASIHSFKHNSREEKRTAKTVFKEHSHLNEYSRSAVDAKQMFDDLYQEAISKISGRTRRAKKENCLVEAVVNLNADHTLEDVEKLAKKIEQETGFTCLQIAIHKDEGQEQDGKLIRKNHHAHISFFTLDLQTGRQMFRREHLTRSKLSKIQDITAETLGMQRGEKNSRRERLSHKEYKEHIKQVEKERATQKATQKQLKEEIAQLRAELREANKQLKVKIYTKDDYAKINKLNRELQEQIKKKELTLMELREQIADLRKELEEKEQQDLKNIKELAEMREKLEEQKQLNYELEQEKNAKYNQVKIFNKIFTKIAQEFDVETKSYGQIRDDVISKYISAKQEVQELKETINTQKTTISTLWKEKGDLRLQVIENQKFEQSYNFVNSKNVELLKKLRDAEGTIDKLEKEKSDLEHQVQENQKAERSYNYSKNDELQNKLNDAEKTIETLEKEKSDLIAKYREIRDAFTEIAQAIGIKFTTVKQVVADIISKFKTAKEVETTKEPELWKLTVESAEKFNRQNKNKYPKLK